MISEYKEVCIAKAIPIPIHTNVRKILTPFEQKIFKYNQTHFRNCIMWALETVSRSFALTFVFILDFLLRSNETQTWQGLPSDDHATARRFYRRESLYHLSSLSRCERCRRRYTGLCYLAHHRCWNEPRSVHKHVSILIFSNYLFSVVLL